MLLLYPREILILDLELSQTVGVVAIERSGVPFTQVKWGPKAKPAGIESFRNSFAYCFNYFQGQKAVGLLPSVI